MAKKTFLPKKRYCQKCGELHYAETHHCYPQKYYGDSKGTLELCRDCHVSIHYLIDWKGKLFKYLLDTIHKRWLKGIITTREDVEYAIKTSKKCD